MLLFDTEHQTCADTRKRLIQKDILSPEDELAFLNVIFTSPLPRHTKSPILWFHRRFVLERLQDPPSLQEEMSIIFKAGEQHPKNYHAWTYARYAWEKLWPFPEAQSQLPQLPFRIQVWCMANVGDHSGWMFYLWLMGAQRPWRKNLEELERPVEVVKKVVQKGIRVTPGHEAMWAFVRGCAIGMEGVLNKEERRVIIEMVQEYLSELEERKQVREAETKDLATLKRYTRMIEYIP
jgi:hypothetical protein